MDISMAFLAILLAPLALAQQQSSPANSPPATAAMEFRSAEVEGKTIRYLCQGTGSPTVIVEQGGGISLENVFSWERPIGWAALAPRIATLTRICVYDRIGLGRSNSAERARTSFDIASDLHALLTTEKITPPYVLAGQSLGGMNAFAFTSRYRDEVAGLVLIDSSHPWQLERINKVLPPRRDDESAVMRGFRDGPDRSAMGGEWFDFGKNSEQFANKMSIGSVPLIVLTAAPQPPNDTSPLPREWQLAIGPLHQELQRELAATSSESQHIVASKAGHNIQIDEPQLVLDAITDLVRRARSKP